MNQTFAVRFGTGCVPFRYFIGENSLLIGPFGSLGSAALGSHLPRLKGIMATLPPGTPLKAFLPQEVGILYPSPPKHWDQKWFGLSIGPSRQ